MKYEHVLKARFLSRPNRFVALVELDGREMTVHVKNTGRCRELLLPGATVYLEDFSGRMGKRKLPCDLVAVEKGAQGLLINMDAQAPNRVVEEALREGTLCLPGLTDPLSVRPETVFGDSRFDFFVRDGSGREGYLEVKGVTLEEDGVASFPDAPTERGVKHIRELVSAREQGYAACILFVIQMEGMTVFRPNDACHKAFGEALRYAASQGVTVLARQCAVTPGSLRLTTEVPVDLFGH